MPIQGFYQVMCTDPSTQGSVTASINFDPSTGAFTSGLTVVNNGGSTEIVTLTNQSGQSRTVSVPPGTTTVTQAQLSAFGYTNVSQIQGFSISC